jgi:dTDP-4-amino-4,6-dideoxygalactose transaminase
MHAIPFLDLARLHESVRPQLDEAFDRVMRRGTFIEGPELDAFEREFAACHGIADAAGVGSGTDALTLALRALGVGPGDEVVVPSMTFIATAEAVVHVGATPIIADVDPETLLLTPDTVDPVLSGRTRAVIPVHLYGHVVPPSHLEQWRRRGLLVLEDAAQAHLAERDGVGVGQVGHAACFSFYPGKNLGAMGDGGMVVSNDIGLIAEVRRIRNHGCTTKYEHEVAGYCSRLDGLQAAMLRVKLELLPGWTTARRTLAEHYLQRLTRAGVRTVPWEPGDVHHLLVIRVASVSRDRVRGALAAQNIETGIHYPIPLSRQQALSSWWRSCPNAELAATEMLSLPIDPLMTTGDVDRVVQVVGALEMVS